MRGRSSLLAAALALLAAGAPAQEAAPRPRAREFGVAPGVYEPGRWNAITDVEGVRAGHRTVIRGNDVRTGVTAILPHGGNLFERKVPAAVFVLNGFGKMIGLAQIEELGVLETPILLTNTLAVWAAADALKRYTLRLPGNEAVRSVNPVVGETNDGRLNDIRGEHLTEEDFLAAIESAATGPLEEGAVGAGTGTICFGFKGGIGSSSRVLPRERGGYTLGVLTQTNFGGQLTIDGVPVGRELAAATAGGGGAGGSVMVIVATDAPLNARQLKRVARRAAAGLARTGSSLSHSSGDFVLAFSTEAAPAGRAILRPWAADENLSPLFQAAIEATEEAVYNSLFQARTLTGKGGVTVAALPLDRVREVFRNYGRQQE